MTCWGKAFTPEGVNSKRTSHWLGTLRPFASGELNSQRRMAFSARSAKYLLGPGFSKSAAETLPEASTWASTVTRTLPEMVARAFSEASGRTWSSTSPFPEAPLAEALEPGAELFAVSGEALVSVRSAAGEGEVIGAWETSFGEGFAAAVFEESRDESRVGEEAFGFAARETSAPFGCSSDCGATRAAVFVEGAEEDSTRLPRILGNAMMEATTTKATASGTT